MDYFHTISALHHKLLDYFTNVIGITCDCIKLGKLLYEIYKIESSYYKHNNNRVANFTILKGKK